MRQAIRNICRSGKRDDLVIATKAYFPTGPDVNARGASRRHLARAVEASLRRLGTDRIDLFFVHRFDDATDLHETLRALDDLVRAGKVRYICCSNFTGWQLMKSLAISEKYGWEKFVTLESKYSLACRGLEYELVPLCLDQSVAILPWSPLHSGYLTGKYRWGEPLPTGTRFANLEDKFWPVQAEKLYDIVKELDRIAKEHNATVSQTALNYLLRKPGVNSLIVGLRTAQQLEENLKATDWEMTPEEVAHLDALSEPVHEYPYFTYDPEMDAWIKH